MTLVQDGMAMGGTFPMDSLEAEEDHRPQPIRLMVICIGLAFALFFALGSWQLQRLRWKLELIERVEQRVHAPAVTAPGPDRWPRINAMSDEYRHVRLTGRFLYDLTARVQASTALGPGFWLLTPLRDLDGTVVLVNRGFVSAKAVDERHDEDADDVTVITGLLRISEPNGAFLRHNDAAANRWYSRDVDAIAAARGLYGVAPYFVDADAAAKPAGQRVEDGSSGCPVGGLTVIAFRNNHLIYAFTWYALALMAAGACLWIVREQRRGKHVGSHADADPKDRGSKNGGPD